MQRSIYHNDKIVVVVGSWNSSWEKIDSDTLMMLDKYWHLDRPDHQFPCCLIFLAFDIPPVPSPPLRLKLISFIHSLVSFLWWTCLTSYDGLWIEKNGLMFNFIQLVQVLHVNHNFLANWSSLTWNNLRLSFYLGRNHNHNSTISYCLWKPLIWMNQHLLRFSQTWFPFTKISK